MFAIIISFAKTKLECALQPCPPPCPCSRTHPCPCHRPVLPLLVPLLPPLGAGLCSSKKISRKALPAPRLLVLCYRWKSQCGGEGVPREPPGPLALGVAQGDAGCCREPLREVSRASLRQVWPYVPRSGVGVSMGRGRKMAPASAIRAAQPPADLGFLPVRPG